MKYNKIAVQEVDAMSNHILYKGQIDFKAEPLFLGTGRNVSRLELNLEQGIQKQTDAAVGKMWFKNDFGYLEDAKDYGAMDDKLRTLYLKNFKFQTLGDSAASRTVAEVFLPITTNPQLESWWFQHAFFENNIHSATYAEIIKVMPLETNKVFDDIMINPQILSRVTEITDVFEETVIYNAVRLLSKSGNVNIAYDLDEHKRLIAKSLYALNILEFMLFKSSFITSFAFKEKGLMTATGDAIKKILLDELGHGAMTTNLINRLRVDPEWAAAFNDVKAEATEMYHKAIRADHKWAEYLCEDNVVLIGISESILKQYTNYNAINVTRAIGIDLGLPKTFNPCVWADKYTKSSNIQTAQKEKSNGNYLLGKLDMNVTPGFWESL
jgi:ribonucleoside-diphosphate reductase beta chain